MKTLTHVKGRAATEQDAVARVYQEAERDRLLLVELRLYRTIAGDVEYGAILCDRSISATA